MASSGAPRAHRAPHSFAKAHVGNLLETIGKLRFFVVPPFGWIRGNDAPSATDLVGISSQTIALVMSFGVIVRF